MIHRCSLGFQYSLSEPSEAMATPLLQPEEVTGVPDERQGADECRYCLQPADVDAPGECRMPQASIAAAWREAAQGMPWCLQLHNSCLAGPTLN